MLFEVMKDDQIVACTDQICCIYSDARLKDIQQAGFTFRLNGKKTTIKAIKSFRDSKENKGVNINAQ